MKTILFEYYYWFKALHVISVISWMAALLYLPRLFVYHSESAPGSVQSETFKVMERRLARAIMRPAMIGAWMFGLVMIFLAGETLFQQGWLHLKLALVFLLTAMHGVMERWRKTFERDENMRPAKFYRIANEVPTLLMIAIVVLVIVRPF